MTDFYNKKLNTLAALRRHPYPYRAMLSICSDLDETPDKNAYFETIKYLNSTEDTVMGAGVGLEVGNTIYFDMPEDQFSYWGTDDDGREKIRACIKSGHIDCIHSFGDFANTREYAKKALDELAENGCKLEVWIDHAVAPSNLGTDIMKGEGDIPKALAYHSDLSYDYGIRYIWRGRVTSVVGQNIPKKLFKIWKLLHPIASFKTFLKEVIKVLLAKMGSVKYGFHAKNQLLRKVHLCSGQAVFEFMRCNPFWGGLEKSETGDGLANVLTPSVLNDLIDNGGFSIIYTHLGKVRDKAYLFSDATKSALESLSKISRIEKKILVTTTRRLLGYTNMLQEATYDVNDAPDLLTIKIKYEGPEDDVAGLTFYVPSSKPVSVQVNNKRVEGLIHNEADETGKVSVSIPWIPLVLKI